MANKCNTIQYKIPFKRPGVSNFWKHSYLINNFFLLNLRLFRVQKYHLLKIISIFNLKKFWKLCVHLLNLPALFKTVRFFLVMSYSILLRKISIIISYFLLCHGLYAQRKLKVPSHMWSIQSFCNSISLESNPIHLS